MFRLVASKPYWAIWLGFAGGVIALLGVAVGVRNSLVEREIRAQTPVYFGELTPGNQETELIAGLPRDTILLRLGSVSLISSSRPQYVLAHDQQPFLTIAGGEHGLRISTSVMSVDHHRIARVIDNEFKVDPEHSFNPKQPDPHTLVVRDEDGNEVLRVTYLNKRAISVLGTFYMEGKTRPASITSQGIRWPDGQFVGGALTLDVSQGHVQSLLNF